MVNLVRWLRSNLGTLALSLLVGLTIWVIVNQEQNPVREADFQPDVKIAVTGLGDGLVITNDYPAATRLRVRAQQDTWSQLTADRFSVTADLSGLGPGTYQIALHNSVDAHATIDSATPNVVTFVIEEVKTRELPIQTQLDGKLAVGWTAGKASIVPARVQATGPKSAVDLISEVRATVVVDGVRQTIKKTLPLVALDSNGNEITKVTLNPAEADIELPLVHDAGYRDLPIVPQPIGYPAAGYYIAGLRVVPDLITVRGDPLIVGAMQPYAETLPVYLNGLTSDLVQEVTLDLPPGVTPVDNTKIQVIVTVKALQGSRKFSPSIKVVGLGTGLSTTLSPTTVDLILSGPVAILDQLDPDIDLVVTIDLTGLGVGTYNVEPKVQISRSEVSNQSMFPTVISVTIKKGP